MGAESGPQREPPPGKPWVPVDPEITRKHFQLIQLIWSADGTGQRYYAAVEPRRTSYGKFLKKVTELVCRGAEEGWIEIAIPPNPLNDQGVYRIHCKDPERFVEELKRLFPG